MVVLHAYQTHLLKDLEQGQGLSPEAVAELRHTTDLALWATKETAAVIGRSMAVMVATVVGKFREANRQHLKKIYRAGPYLCQKPQRSLAHYGLRTRGRASFFYE